jgi:hypothetical protein
MQTDIEYVLLTFLNKNNLFYFNNELFYVTVEEQIWRRGRKKVRRMKSGCRNRRREHRKKRKIKRC